jgi:glc operon protein GlcG
VRIATRAGIALAALVLTAAAAPMAAQQQAPAVARITLADARTALDAAEAEARGNGWNLAFVISDAEGTPIYLRRMDGVPKRNYDIAMNKISTAITAGMHTAEYAAAVRAGTMEPIPGAFTFDGGLLLRRDGQVVGAFSASGASGAQDAQAVRAGMAAIGIQPSATPAASKEDAQRPADDPAAAAQAAVSVPVELLERYVGEYEVSPTAFVTVRRNGDTLTAQPSGQPEPTVLEPRSQNRFAVRGVPAEVEFVTDAAGVVNLVLHQGGQEFQARRRITP